MRIAGVVQVQYDTVKFDSKSMNIHETTKLDRSRETRHIANTDRLRVRENRKGTLAALPLCCIWSGKAKTQMDAKKWMNSKLMDRQ